MTLRGDCFKAVWKAHRDASGMLRRPSITEVASYIEAYKGHVTGIYSKWIITSSILKGDKIFSSIKEKDFYKI